MPDPVRRFARSAGNGPRGTDAKEKEPLVGNQLRFARRTLRAYFSRQRQGGMQPFFGTRLRWAASVIREARQKDRRPPEPQVAVEEARATERHHVHYR